MLYSAGLILVTSLMLAFVLLGCSSRFAYVGGYQADFRRAPAPPAGFDHAPHMALVAGSQVSILDEADPGFDLFEYAGAFYVQKDGYWYRSARYDHVFEAVDARCVPRQVFGVPHERWHHRPSGASVWQSAYASR